GGAPTTGRTAVRTSPRGPSPPRGASGGGSHGRGPGLHRCEWSSPPSGVGFPAPRNNAAAGSIGCLAVAGAVPRRWGRAWGLLPTGRTFFGDMERTWPSHAG